MKVSNTKSYFIGEKLQKEQCTKKEEEPKKNYAARELNQDLFENRLLQKKKQAQEKAMKVVSDAFAGDRKIDDDIQERREKIAALNQDNQELLHQVNEIEQWQEAFQEESGILQDSEEQKGLELLRKEEKYQRGEGEALTKEEQEAVNQLKKEGLTDYQKRQREWDAQKHHFQKEIEKNQKQILEETAIIRGTKLERLKSAPMVKASKEADSILDAAGKEILGMIFEEAKDTIDKNREEEKEKAEKLEEEQKKKEEFIEKQKEKKNAGDEILENMPVEEMVNMGQLKNEVQRDIKNIMNEMKLVAEDIKGARVDEEI